MKIGDIWRASTEVTRNVFLYKYVVVDNNTDAIVRWELGYNRLADLDIAYKQGLFTDGEYIFRDVRSFFFKNIFFSFYFSITKPSNLL